MLQTAMLERKVRASRPNGQAAFLGTSPDAQPFLFEGVGCLAVTFTVGGLSAINAVAGAYAEDLPVVCITGVSMNCLHLQLFSVQQTDLLLCSLPCRFPTRMILAIQPRHCTTQLLKKTSIRSTGVFRKSRSVRSATLSLLVMHACMYT